MQSTERKWALVQACRLAHLSVCRSVQWVNCGKTADWIWMSFGVVSKVGRGISVLDAGLMEIVEGEWACLFTPQPSPVLGYTAWCRIHVY